MLFTMQQKVWTVLKLIRTIVKESSIFLDFHTLKFMGESHKKKIKQASSLIILC